MKKKVLSILLTAAMISTMLAGCGDDSKESSQDSSQDSTSNESSTEEESSDSQESSAEGEDANAGGRGSHPEVGDLGRVHHTVLGGH